MTPEASAASIPYEGTDCTPEEAVEAVKAVRSSAASVTVEIDVEVTRRERLRFEFTDKSGFGKPGVPGDIARFWHTLNFHVQGTRDLAKREDATLVRLRFITDEDKAQEAEHGV